MVLFEVIQLLIHVAKNKRSAVEWSAVEKGHTVVNSENKTLMTIGERSNIQVEIHPTPKNKVRVIAKSNNPQLEGVNRFMKKALLDEYWFVEPKGWGPRI